MKRFKNDTTGEKRVQAMTLGAASLDDRVLHGEVIIREIKASGIEFVVSVPDRMTSEGLLRPLSRLQHPRHLRVSREDESLGIAAGLAYCDRRALVLMQHTGLLDSINALRAIGAEYALPICMMVGLLSKEPGVPPADSSKYGIRIVVPILDAMGVAHHWLEDDADTAAIRPAIDLAYSSSRPVVFLIGRMPVAS
jgi:sulfopyruvate decarboxylase TPP-binding subunit